jgi:hypothetical protein
LGDHLNLLNKEGGIYQSLCKTQGITPSNPGTTKEVNMHTTPNAIKRGSNSNGDSARSGKAQAGLSELEGGYKDDAEDAIEDDEVDVVPMAPMSKIWKFLGIDTLYAVMGVIGSAGVGALSPCESILTAQIVT